MGCSVEVAEELSTKGSLRRITDGDKVFVRAQDIDEIIRLSGGVEMPPEDMRRRILFLEKQVQKLQEALDLIFQINQMSSTKLDPMDDDTLSLLFTNIRDEFDGDEWSIKRILSCCELYLRISELEVERLNALFSIEDSWRPFFALCLKQLRYVSTHEDFPIDVNLQRCRDILCRSRNNLRSIAIIFIELSAAKNTSYQFLARLASADVDAFDDLMQQMKAKNPRGCLELL